MHPRYKQMKDIRPFEEIIAEQVSDRLSDQTCLSILSWNAGLKREAIQQTVWWALIT